MPTKQCKRCNIYKPLSDYYQSDKYKNKSLSWCKKCTKDRATETHRMQKTGCSKEHYDMLFQQQDGCCAICNKHVSDFNEALAVDHCHMTKQIRGLLCGKCNRAIGLLNDDVVLLESAISYLTKGN